MLPLANIIGIYLLTGTVLMGMGLIRKAGWIESGKLKETPMGKYGKLSYGIGVTFGVLFWPVFLIGITLIWRMKGRTRKLERFMGYCGHSTVLEPICGPCSRQIERENTSTVTKYLVSPEEAAKRHLVGTLRRLNDVEGKLREKMEDYIKARPECPKCGKVGGLSQFMDSVWVKCASCGRRTFTPDPSVPEEVDMVPTRPAEGWIVGVRPVEGQMAGASYKCSVCEMTLEGFPPATNEEGFPICMACQKKPPD